MLADKTLLKIYLQQMVICIISYLKIRKTTILGRSGKESQLSETIPTVIDCDTPVINSSGL